MYYLVSHLLHNFLYGSICILGLYLLKYRILDRYGGKVYLALWILPIFSFLNPVSIKVGIPGYFIDDTITRNLVPAYRVPIGIGCTILFGVAAVLIIKYLLEKRKTMLLMHATMQPPPDNAEALLAQIKQKVGVSRYVEIGMITAVHSPATFYHKHAVIVLPEYAFSEEQLALVIEHELWHIKGHHVVYKELASFIRMVFWWNPLTYSMRNNVSEACEFACDQSVLGETTEAAKHLYEDTIIETIEFMDNKYRALTYYSSEEGITKRTKLIHRQAYRKAIVPVAFGILMVIGNLFSFRSVYVPIDSNDFGETLHSEFEIVEQYNGLFDVYQNGDLIAIGVDKNFVSDITGGE